MIFKNVEIVLLTTSSKTRWLLTFLTVGIIVSGWWVCAFLPLRTQLRSAEHTLKNLAADDHESDQRAIVDAATSQVITKRVTFVGDHHYFLKDLLRYQLNVTQLTSEKTEKIGDVTATTAKIAFSGTFTHFYEFLRDQQKNYLCLWNSCVCEPCPEGGVSITADVTLYYR